MPARWRARYKSGPERYRDVISWDPVTGAALVVDEKAGQLQPAVTFPGFDGLEEDVLTPVVAVLPGQGWKVSAKTEDGESVLLVIGFTVDEHGHTVPITVDKGECEGSRENIYADGVSLIPPES